MWSFFLFLIVFCNSACAEFSEDFTAREIRGMGIVLKAEQLKKDGMVAALKAAPKYFKDLAKSIRAGRGNSTAVASTGGKKTVRFADETKQPAPKQKDWIREPLSIQDQMVLAAAKRGEGRRIMGELGDPKFKDMEKMQLKVKSLTGKDTVVHYVRDPKTGELMDFKFKKRSTD